MLVQADKKIHIDAASNSTATANSSSVFAANIGSLLQNLQPQDEEDLKALAKVKVMLNKMSNKT